MKKLLVTFAVVAAFAMLASLFPSFQQTAIADDDDDVGYSCPQGDQWNGPAPEFWVLPDIDRGDWTDYNGDGQLCYRIPKGFCANRGQGEGAPVCSAWVWKDNDNPDKSED